MTDLLPYECKNVWDDEVARELDKFWSLNLQENLLHTIEGALGLAYAAGGDSVLEVGCGTGRIYEVLKNGRITYTGLDSSPAMLRVFKERCPEVQTIEADATKIPLPDNSFDLVVCFEVLRHTQHYKEIIAELYRVAKREVLFTVEVTEGPTRMIGEDRKGAYLSNRDAGDMHFQLELCSSDFIMWLRSTYSCNIVLRTITSNKYAFALHKRQKGYGFTVVPVCGMDLALIELFQHIAAAVKMLCIGDETPLFLSVSVNSLHPLEIVPTIKVNYPSKDLSTPTGDGK